jgi:hypothetical protein
MGFRIGMDIVEKREKCLIYVYGMAAFSADW